MRSACSLPCGRISGGGGEGRPMLNLMLVIRSIKVAERVANQAVGGELPLLESADAHAMAGSARTRVAPEERPMENRAITLNDEIVKENLHVGKRGHELLGSLSDPTSAHRRRAAVNR